MANFRKQLAAIAKKKQVQLNVLAKAVKIETFSRIADGTRVKTGRLRANWNASDGAPDKTVTDNTDINGADTKQKIESNITGNSVSYITNGLPYAAVINEMDGIIPVALAEMKDVLKKELNKIK